MTDLLGDSILYILFSYLRCLLNSCARSISCAAVLYVRELIASSCMFKEYSM